MKKASEEGASVMTHTSTISNIPYLDLKRITEMHLDELTQAVNDVVRSGGYLQG